MSKRKQVTYPVPIEATQLPSEQQTECFGVLHAATNNICLQCGAYDLCKMEQLRNNANEIRKQKKERGIDSFVDEWDWQKVNTDKLLKIYKGTSRSTMTYEDLITAFKMSGCTDRNVLETRLDSFLKENQCSEWLR